MDEELQQKNVRLGILLFALFWIFFAATVVAAFFYLHFS